MARDEGAEVGSRDGTGEGEVTRSEDAATGPGLETLEVDPSIDESGGLVEQDDVCAFVGQKLRLGGANRFNQSRDPTTVARLMP